MSVTLKQKTNEAFYRECIYKDSDGNVINITGYTIHMDVRDKNGTLVYAFSIGTGITVTSAVGGAFAIQLNDISTWQEGLSRADIVFTDSFGVTTETFYIQVIDGITDV